MSSSIIAKILEEGDVKYFLRVNDDIERNANELFLMSLHLDKDSGELVLLTIGFTKENGSWEEKSKDRININEDYDFTAVKVGVDYLVKLVRKKMDNQNIKHVVLENTRFAPVMLTTIEDRIEEIKNFK